MVKLGLATLTCVVVAVFASNVSASSASTAAVRVSAGSCPGATVPAVVNATFVCLSIGGPCTARFEEDYAKYQLVCAAGRLSKPRPASAPAVADAFLNTKKSDVSTRTTIFKVAGAPPILHLTFKKALAGPHKLSVDVHNATTDVGRTFDTTLQTGWQFMYQVLPTSISNSYAGTYRVTISIDGAGKKELSYSVKP